MNMTPYVTIWSVFAVVVIGLAFYRKMLAGREDDSLHVSDGGARLIPEQLATAHRIEVVDKWGKSLTIFVVATGLLLAAFYIYGVWQSGSTGAIVR